jgi:rhodanese-related sulfurtransferase
MGGRSAQAVAFLQAQGYCNVKNLTGGIIRWIDDVDDTLTRY